jgi:LPXTG-motif cell wall-anchored protein
LNEVEAINRLLYRKLRDNSRYDKYFENNSCPVVNQGKGQTEHGVEVMKKYVYSYLDQSKSISINEFSAYDLITTVNKIHEFLYWSLQYKLNTDLQKVQTPGCSWAIREADCKSYSVFASSILINLGIQHYIRRVAVNFESHYSHVYVIIPKDQNSLSINDTNDYYVIDATLLENIEQDFTANEDIIMRVNEPELEYVGMGMPGITSSPLTTSNYTQREIYNDSVLLGMENFDSYIDSLRINDDKAQQMRQIIYDSLVNGYDPSITIRQNSIEINQKVFKKIPNYGLGTTAPPQDGSFNISDHVDVNQVLGSGFFSNTFGAIFANGMNLSCWNSSFLPQNTAAEIQQIQGPYFESLFRGLETATSVQELENRVNHLSMAVYVCAQMYWQLRTGNNWRKCSRLALDQYNELFYELVPAFESIIDQLSTMYTLNQLDVRTAPMAWTFNGYDHSWSENGNADYPVFTIKGTQIISNPTDPIIPTGNPTTGNPSGYVPGNNNQGTGDDPPKTSNSNTVYYVVGGLLLAGTGLYIFNKNKNKN